MIAESPAGSARRPVHEGRILRLGRAPTAAPEEIDVDPWVVIGDPRLSRMHAELRRRGDRVEVRRLPKARNPLFFRGEAKDVFELAAGEHFVVGHTTVRLVAGRYEAATDDHPAVPLVGYTLDEARLAPYRDADERLEVLSSLPEVIRGAADEGDLFSRLVLLLLEGVPSAEVAAIVRRRREPEEPTAWQSRSSLHAVTTHDPSQAHHDPSPANDRPPVPRTAAGDGDATEPDETTERAIEVCHWDRRRESSGEFRPSRRLILDAIDHRRHSVRTFWGQRHDDGGGRYTVSANLDWAFCTPVPGEACEGWGLYVTGRNELAEGEPDLRPDLKFTELMAAVLGALRDVQQLQRRQLTLSRFFSPLALPVLTRSGREALAPRETPVSVMFCDLRGFSRAAEHSAGELLDLLERVGQALDVMTEAIHAHQGVIGDFQGDAALAFWGWPLDSVDTVAAACRAALDIRQLFASAGARAEDPLSDFRCGIGIASGEAVVGLLGTRRQSKIGVFGPVVNLASRLEGITKQLEVPILIDETTAAALGRHDDLSFRRLARVRPYGLETALVICELLPATGDGALGREHLAAYDAALEAFHAGRWDEAVALLHQVPHWDRGKDFLTSYILRHHRQPPMGWDGIIPLDRK